MVLNALSTSYLWLQRNKAIVVLCSIGVRKTLDIVGQQGSILSSVDIFHLCNSLHVFWGEMLLLGSSKVSESVHFRGCTEGLS